MRPFWSGQEPARANACPTEVLAYGEVEGYGKEKGIDYLISYVKGAD